MPRSQRWDFSTWEKNNLTLGAGSLGNDQDDDSDAVAEDYDGYHDHDFDDDRLEHHNLERREEEQELWEHHQVNVVQFLTQVIVIFVDVFVFHR